MIITERRLRDERRSGSERRRDFRPLRNQPERRTGRDRRKPANRRRNLWEQARFTRWLSFE